MRTILSLVLLVACAGGALAAADWHHPLYIGNDGFWKQRIAIEVRNDMDREVEGEPVALVIGTAVGNADLVGASAEAVRVCNEQGIEMLFDITARSGRPIKKGPIPAGATLTLPAECAPNDTATYYAYFDNPQAWQVPDFLNASTGVRNGGLEGTAGDVPDGWGHDANDDEHETLWVTENPRSGKKCLKTVVAEGAEHTWIATRQTNIHIIGGADYMLTAWVKAENIEGNAGWYIHVGNTENSMIISPMLYGGDGTYDWKKVTATFRAPEGANKSDLGTVLRGTGTAWFDDVTLECLDGKPSISATAAKPETLDVTEVGANAAWYDDNPNDGLAWERRAPVKVINLSDQTIEALVRVDFSVVTARLRGAINPESIRVTDGDERIAHCQAESSLLLDGRIPPRTIKTYYVYFSTDPRIEAAPDADYASLLNSDRNLVKNPGFELGDDLPDDWPGAVEGEGAGGRIMELDSPGLFGERCAKMYIPHDAQKAWTGWRQDVPVEPRKTYLFSAWLKTEDITPGVQLHAHFRNPEGQLCQLQGHTGAGPPITGTQDWTMLSGVFEMPEDIGAFQLHLTMLATGTVWHDGVVLVEAVDGTVGNLESRTSRTLAGLTAWPVNSVVKVFQADVPPEEIPPARITAARNDKEPLQLALRAPTQIGSFTVQVDPPTNPQGAKLTDIEVTHVGYVPVDHKTGYYNSNSPAWQRKFPTAPGNCDGWAGWWPDPLLPADVQETWDLAADTTGSIWITVSVPKDAAPGDYAGTVRITNDGATLTQVPFTLHVWDFTLPDENHVTALYDVRQGGKWWREPGKTVKQVREEFWRFMADRRVCSNHVMPAPKITYEGGEASADFTEFDQACDHYFNDLKMTQSYLPWYFYGFGWGHEPRKAWGEDPYPGEYPYTDADHAVLRPEYKQAYQTCLGLFWNHLKETGFADKFVLYISDEPFDRHERIIEQMKALCDMIHEVDPDIPIYCSTWRHIPAWNGYLDVWGIGHDGRVMPDVIAERQAAGDTIWWTTDGQMCTDTPYCAIERLLPHYCFKYDAKAYEFWGIDWLTYDPFEYGWHRYNPHTFEGGGETRDVRYPNGDGFLAYPGGAIGREGALSSVRLEQAREGVEDYEYLYMLRDLVAKAKAAGRDASAGEAALKLADELVEMPCKSGRYSTAILPNPDAVFEVKEAVAKAIEGLR